MRNLLIVFLIFLIPALAVAQKKIRYKADGSQKYVKVNGIGIRYLVENVVFIQDNTTIYCDSAVYYKDENKMEAYNNVRIIDDSTVITSNVLVYEGNSRKARLRGKVIYRRGTQMLITENLDYNLENEIGYYFGGGKLIDPTNTLTSTQAYYYAQRNTAIFYKDVVLVSPEYTLKTDTLEYTTTTKVAVTEGYTEIINADGTEIFAKGGEFKTEVSQTSFVKGKVETRDYILDGDDLFFDDINRYYKAKGNVVLTSKEHEVIITGDEAYYDRDNGFSKIYGNPIMKRILQADTFYIAADTLMAIEGEYDSMNRVLAYPNLRIFKTNLQGIADSAAYFLTDSIIKLYQTPILWTGGNQISADSIQIYITANSIELMELRKNSFMISLDTLKNMNQIKGRNMSMVFLDNDLHHVEVDGNCESIFYSLEADTLMLGINKLVCSRMLIRLENNEIVNFSIYTNPEGRFIPPHEITPEDEKLEGFNWEPKSRPDLKDIYNKPVKEKPTEKTVPRPTRIERISAGQETPQNPTEPQKSKDN